MFLGDLTVQLLPQFWVSKSSITLPATDVSYYPGPYSTFKSLDEENKILYFYDSDGAILELNYGR